MLILNLPLHSPGWFATATRPFAECGVSDVFAQVFELMQGAYAFVFYWKMCSGFSIIFVQLG